MLVVSVLMTGCSTVQMAYDNSDRILLRYVDHYLELDTEQKKRLRAGLRQRLDDHRRRELARYVAYLNAVSSAVAARLTEARVDQLAECGRILYEATVANTIPVLTPVLSRLDQRQLEHLSRRLDENNRNYRQEYLRGTVDERLEARATRTIGIVDYWTGDLTLGQRKLIGEISRTWPDLAEDWYAYRLERQKAFLILLRDSATDTELKDYLSGWWLDGAGQKPALRQRTLQLMQGVKALVLAVDQSITPSQREHVLERIRDLRDDLADLLRKKDEQLVAANESLPSDTAAGMELACSSEPAIGAGDPAHALRKRVVLTTSIAVKGRTNPTTVTVSNRTPSSL